MTREPGKFASRYSCVSHFHRLAVISAYWIRFSKQGSFFCSFLSCSYCALPFWCDLPGTDMVPGSCRACLHFCVSVALPSEVSHPLTLCMMGPVLPDNCMGGGLCALFCCLFSIGALVDRIVGVDRLWLFVCSSVLIDQNFGGLSHLVA